MQFDWQTLLALGVVTAAVVVLAVRARRLIAGHGRAGCHTSCDSCKESAGAAGLKRQPVVELRLNSEEAEPHGEERRAGSSSRGAPGRG